MKKALFVLAFGMAAVVGGCKEFDPSGYSNIEIICTSKTMEYSQKVVAKKVGDKLNVSFYNLQAVSPLQFTASYPIDSQFAKRFFKRMNPEKMIKMHDSSQIELNQGRYDYSVKLDNDENGFTLYAPCSFEVVVVPAKALGLMANTDKLFSELQNEAGRRNSHHNDNAPTP